MQSTEGNNSNPLIPEINQLIWSGNKSISHDGCYTPYTRVQLPYTLVNQLIIDQATNLSVMTVDIHQIHRYSYHTHLHHAYWVMTADIHQMHRHRYHTHLHWAFWDSWYTQNAQVQLPYTLTPSILSNRQASQVNNRSINFTVTGTAARHSE